MHTSGSGSSYQCIVAVIINCNIVNKTNNSVLCWKMRQEARLDQFPRPVVAQQNPRMMPSEEWPWPAPAVTLHIVKGDSRQEQEDRSAPPPYTNYSDFSCNSCLLLRPALSVSGSHWSLVPTQP